MPDSTFLRNLNLYTRVKYQWDLTALGSKWAGPEIPHISKMRSVKIRQDRGCSNINKQGFV